MAITTLDAAIEGAQPPQIIQKFGSACEAAGVFHSAAYAAGTPGAAAAPSPGIAGAALTSYAGQIGFNNPVSGETRILTLGLTATVVSSTWVYDRLWHNSGIVVTTTTAQTINSAAWPARDRNGSTNGEGILIALEVSTATTNVGAITNMTMSYTNSEGTAGKTATVASFPATAVAGTLVFFQLAAGDKGVRSIQSITLGTSLVTGTVHLVALRTLGQLRVLVANTGDRTDFITGGAVKLYDNTVPFIYHLATATTAVNHYGDLVYTQG
jgi:hypothetical protein